MRFKEGNLITILLNYTYTHSHRTLYPMGKESCRWFPTAGIIDKGWLTTIGVRFCILSISSFNVLDEYGAFPNRHSYIMTPASKSKHTIKHISFSITLYYTRYTHAYTQINPYMYIYTSRFVCWCWFPTFFRNLYYSIDAHRHSTGRRWRRTRPAASRAPCTAGSRAPCAGDSPPTRSSRSWNATSNWQIQYSNRDDDWVRNMYE